MDDENKKKVLDWNNLQGAVLNIPGLVFFGRNNSEPCIYEYEGLQNGKNSPRNKLTYKQNHNNKFYKIGDFVLHGFSTRYKISDIFPEIPREDLLVSGIVDLVLFLALNDSNEKVNYTYKIKEIVPYDGKGHLVLQPIIIFKDEILGLTEQTWSHSRFSKVFGWKIGASGLEFLSDTINLFGEGTELVIGGAGKKVTGKLVGVLLKMGMKSSMARKIIMRLINKKVRNLLKYAYFLSKAFIEEYRKGMNLSDFRKRVSRNDNDKINEDLIRNCFINSSKKLFDILIDDLFEKAFGNHIKKIPGYTDFQKEFAEKLLKSFPVSKLLNEAVHNAMKGEPNDLKFSERLNHELEISFNNQLKEVAKMWISWW